MTDWVWSDLHVAHANVMRWYPGRQGRDIGEHCRILLANWNARVKRKDRIYLLGDAALGPGAQRHGQSFYRQANGYKILVRGNHDKDWLIPLFDEVHHYVELNQHKRRIVMMHYPIESWRGMNRGAVHLHGHQHGRGRTKPNRLDVGVDSIGHFPITLDRACELAKKQQHGGTPDHHELTK